VVKAFNFAVALHLIVEEMPDIIVTAIYMAVLNKVEFIEGLRQIPSLSKIPAVVVMVVNALATAIKTGGLGVQHSWTKP